MRKVLVTGATGFVGRAVCRALADGGFDVVASSRTGESDTVVLDVTEDARRIRGLVHQIAPWAVMHVAAAGVSTSRDDLVGLVDVNVRGTAVLLESAAAADVQRFVHVSTVLAAEADDAYGGTKAVAELLVGAVVRHGVPSTVTVRLPTLVGPGDADTKLVPTLVRHAIADEPFELRTPSRVRAYLHVTDAARALVRVCTDEDLSGIVEVPGCAEISLADLDTLIRARSSPSEAPAVLPRRTAVGDLQGWAPLTSLEDAIDQLIEHERSERAL